MTAVRTATTRRVPGRCSDLQTAQVGLEAQLDAWEAQLSPRVFATLIDLHARKLERRLRRYERWLERSAA